MKKTLSARGVYERSIREEDVVLAIRQFLEINGARVCRVIERIPYGRKTSEPGIPDLTGWFPPQKNGIMPSYATHFWIEVKKPGGIHRAAQIVWIARAQADGVIAFFADSVDAVVRGFAEVGIKLKGA